MAPLAKKVPDPRYKATNNYCTLEKINRIKLETLLRIFHPLIYSGNRLIEHPREYKNLL